MARSPFVRVSSADPMVVTVFQGDRRGLTLSFDGLDGFAEYADVAARSSVADGLTFSRGAADGPLDLPQLPHLVGIFAQGVSHDAAEASRRLAEKRVRHLCWEVPGPDHSWVVLSDFLATSRPSLLEVSYRLARVCGAGWAGWTDPTLPWPSRLPGGGAVEIYGDEGAAG